MRAGLAANGVHRALGCLEGRLVDLMAGPFFPNRGPHGSFQDCFLVPPAQKGCDVGFLTCKEAIAKLAVGSQANPVAIQAKWPAHGGDETDSMPVREAVLSRGRTRVGVRRRSQGSELVFEHPNHFIRGEHAIERPQALRVQRHKLDETRL
jgi:hypothetical protein